MAMGAQTYSKASGDLDSPSLRDPQGSHHELELPSSNTRALLRQSAESHVVDEVQANGRYSDLGAPDRASSRP